MLIVGTILIILKRFWEKIGFIQTKTKEIKNDENINKQPPKGKIKFSITLSEEQKMVKTNILYHPYNFVMGKSGSGKTLLVVQINIRYVFYS